MISQEQILNARILIIDDQKLHARYLQKVLEDAGYRSVRTENDPLKALPVIHELQPDLIILDLDMPQLDGFQIIEHLNEFRRNNYLPILAVSPETSAEGRLKALQSGATDIVVQPFEVVEIVIRIRNMIEMRILHMQVQDQNKILESKVQERTKELRVTQLDIIRRLAQAAEFRDNDTGVHIIRMSQFCAKLGEAIGLDDTQCELLLNASPLHDIGKIGIPDSILLKPGKLTPEEYEVMKTHTTMGARLLSGSDSPLMKMAQTIALTHHEKWDGTGYPQKLKGEDIPLLGQLCSVCDVYDALTAARPYKRAWSSEEAVAELVTQKDKHFNPVMVDRFLEILPEIEKIRGKYKDEAS
ncbi:MAG: response regulator [Candidatus Omnitrophota bacterium]|nr:response regulator [Candidatus Omnitrophota bacterium]MDZ4242284.1 response regulator [Candidatus Omnitrophota bacterium]